MSAICQMTSPSSHSAMALYVRSAAISVRTWFRIGRPMPRRAHPDHPRPCSALTTEGEPLLFGFVLPNHATLAVIEQALKAAGVEFTNADRPGVRLRRVRRKD